jgi:hypothetical protein
MKVIFMPELQIGRIDISTAVIAGIDRLQLRVTHWLLCKIYML